MKPAVFLDRDGTLNFDPGYLNDPNKLDLIPRVGEALYLLQQAGFLLVVATNQSGVARGLIQPQQLNSVHEKMNELLKSSQVQIDFFEVCLHHPENNCDCRKPNPKLIQDAAKKYKIDLQSSFMVGDRVTDMEAGKKAGCSGVALVRTGDGAMNEKMSCSVSIDFIGDDLLAAAQWIVGLKNERS